MRGVVLTLPLLGGCVNYGCGDYVVEHELVAFQAGEWCGLQGTYGYADPDPAGLAQVIVTPNSRDEAVVSLIVDRLAIVDVHFPVSALEPGSTVTLDDGMTAVCGLSPEGAGSGSLQFYPADSATVFVGAESSRTLVGDRSFALEWDIVCPFTTSSGDDQVEFSDSAPL